VHFLNLDTIQHIYGPGSPAAYTAIADADDRVRRLLEALRLAGLMSRATVFVVSDHGFKPVRYTINANVTLAQQNIPPSEITVIPEGGTAMVYVNRSSGFDARVRKTKEIFSGAIGVGRILETTEFESIGWTVSNSNAPLPDLVLLARDGYAFSNSGEEAWTPIETGGAHGYLTPDPDMDGIFLAWGKGIRGGTKLKEIAVTDVGPTAAAFLGLKMGNKKGALTHRRLLSAE